MHRGYFLAGIFCFAAAWACRAMHTKIGAFVGPDGILHEPFGLIPLAWLLDFVGLALLVLAWLRRK
jgi:hypothetical protein